MMRETDEIVGFNLDPLPLKTYNNIHEGNALRMDWNNVIPASELNYIMGNPPFIGKKEQTKEQKEDLKIAWEGSSDVGSIDYVSGWYRKAATLMMVSQSIRAAFVSTNSITQGEQVALIWKPLLHDCGIHLDFAYRTFKWTSEASNMAAVHCVILGFSAKPGLSKYIYSNDGARIIANHINPYLIDAPDYLLENHKKPICDVPEITTGNQATDDGNFFFDTDEYEALVNKYPYTRSLFKRAYNSQGFINGKYQYCLWLDGVAPGDIRKCPTIMERVENVRIYRLASPKEQTRRQAETPTLFTEIRQPKGNYIVIPKVSSENRQYIPLGFLSPDIICNNTIKLVPDASLYHFGVLNSVVHNAWMRVVAGRLEMRYQYSNTIVYNNFPWPQPNDAQKAKIEHTAQAILDARSLYPDSSLADLYDSLAMPPELRKAHRANDAAVLEAYGFPKDATESDIVARLFKMYRELTSR